MTDPSKLYSEKEFKFAMSTTIVYSTEILQLVMMHAMMCCRTSVLILKITLNKKKTFDERYIKFFPEQLVSWMSSKICGLQNLLFTFSSMWFSSELSKNRMLWRLLRATGPGYLLVVHRSSETSTNQSDIVIRSDDRYLNHVVDSDSIVFKNIYA